MKKNKYCYQQLINKLNKSIKSSNIDIEKIKKAMIYAMHYHRHQKRASGEPFISHPFAVAEMVLEYYLDTELIIVSVLHDIVEDTKVTFEMLNNSFGPRVASMVKELTRIDDQYQKISILELINNLYKNKFNKELLIIKICDRIHNMQTITYKSEKKIKETTLESINNFIIASIYLEIKPIEKMISNLCNSELIDDLYINLFDENGLLIKGITFHPFL